MYCILYLSAQDLWSHGIFTVSGSRATSMLTKGPRVFISTFLSLLLCVKSVCSKALEMSVIITSQFSAVSKVALIKMNSVITISQDALSFFGTHSAYIVSIPCCWSLFLREGVDMNWLKYLLLIHLAASWPFCLYFLTPAVFGCISLKAQMWWAMTFAVWNP